MKYWYVLPATLLLSGCGALFKTEYQQPAISVPDHWRVQDTQQSSGASLTGRSYLQTQEHWWDDFNDPVLSRLISDVLQTNNDLALAGVTLQRARVQAGLTNVNTGPQFSASGGYSNSKATAKNTEANDSYSATLNMSYELDLWGKVARTREQAVWQVKASEQDRLATALSIIANTAQLYWQIASLNQKIAYQEQNLNIVKETLRLVKAGYEAGSRGMLDYAQAQQSVLDSENQYRSLLQQREEARNALAILFNRPPTERVTERPQLDLTQTIAVPPRIPLAVIAKRPDIQSAEMNLRAALAGTDVARLSFFPSLSLSAGIGASSTIFQQWFSNPVRTLGSSVALPFVQWNKVKLTIQDAKLNVKQAAIKFRQTAYTALSEVDNAMSQRQQFLAQRRNQLQNLELSKKRLAIAQTQYRVGATSFQTLLDAQTALLNIQTSLVDTQYNYLNSTMNLWKALGGGPDNKKDFKEITNG